MKYLTQLILIIALLTQVSIAQDTVEQRVNIQLYTAEQVAEATGGFKDDASDYYADPETQESVDVIKLPEFYDEQLVVSSMNNMVNSFADLHYLMRWNRNGDDITAVLEIDEYESLIILYYLTGRNAIVVTLVDED